MKRLVIGTLVSMAVSGGIAAAALAPSKPSQIITLFNTSGTACGSSHGLAVDHIVKSDGSSAAFTIPAGQVLIITSIDWSAEVATANRRFDFALVSIPGGAFATGGGALSDADFTVSGTLLIPGGLVVKPGVTLCPEVDHGGPAFVESDAAFVRVHGFLAKDK
jgi:hypothetical protein